MRDKITAKRYGEAFVGFAETRIGVDGCVNEMKGLKWLLKENPQFERLLVAPEIPYSEKFSLIDRVFGGRYSDQLCDFLKYLITKNRIALINDIAEYVRMTYAHGDTVEVLVRTTFLLETELIEQIKQGLKNRLGKDAKLYLELDTDLLGGVQLVFGNNVIDGSVKYKLQNLRKQLLKT